MAGHEYAATDTDLGVKVLLTIVESLSAIDDERDTPGPGLADEFQRAMSRMLELDHPLLGMPRRVSSRTSELYWYTSQATDGTPLRRHLEHRGPLDWRSVALILFEATVALGTAHQRGCAHGNIQSDTVVVEPNGAIRFLRPDVAARVLFQHSDSSTISLAALWDEPVFLSPDVLNRRVPSPSDDIYALGVLAYELLTGRLPYASPSEPLGRFQSRRSAPDPCELVSDLPETMSRLVRSMFAPRAAIRIPNAAALRAEIQQQILTGLGPNDGRSQLVDALRARVQGKKSATPAVASGPASSAVDRAEAERVVDQALLSAGMGTGASGRQRSPTRRGLWFGLGLVGAVGLIVALIPSGESLQRSAPSAPISKALNPPPPAKSMEAKPVTPVPVEVDASEVALLKAEALIGSGQLALAQRVLNRALSTDADESGALRMLLASTLASEGRIKEAVAAYIAADGDDENRSSGHLKAGLLVATDGRCVDAIPLFNEFLRRAGSSAEILKLLGNCHLIGGDLTAARDALERAYVADKDDLDIAIPLAQALEKSGERKAALDVYRRAVSLSPNNQRARDGLARLQGGDVQPVVGGVRLAEATSEEAEPMSVRAMESTAHAAFQRGDYSQAARLYGEAIKAAGDLPEPSLLRNHAVALHKAKKLRAAIRAYERALTRLPKDAELHFMLGMALSSQRQDSSAMRALRQALEMQPSNTKARFELGLIALRRGRHSEAAAAFEDTLRREPGNKAALQNLIKARVDGGDQTGALEALGRMHAKHPADSQTLLTMAALLQTMDRDDEAEALLTEACAKGIKQACR